MHDLIVDRMNSYAEAWRSLDPARLAAFYADDPAFRVYVDGQVFTREGAIELAQTACASIQRFEATWHALEVTPLGPDSALASSRFTRSIDDESGTTTEDWGTVTWVWKRVGDEWLIIHGHGVHYPGALPGASS